MNNVEFYKEIDRLVEKGEVTFAEYDIDIEAFQHLKAIKAKAKTNKLANSFLLFILFSLVVVAAVYFTRPEWLDFKKVTLSDSGKNEIIEREALLDSILSENLKLKEIIAKMGNESVLHKGKELYGQLPESHEKITNEADSSSSILIYHVVKGGETLFSLAKQYYGSGSMTATLMADNGISNPSELAVGMTLVIHRK